MSVPTNLIPTKITGLPEYTGNSTLGYFPYVLEGRTYQVQFANLAAVGAVPSTRVVAAGTGLTGGGDLSQDRVIAIANGGVGYSQLANSGVTAGSYGSGSQIPVLTIDDKGRVTSASSVSVTISGYVPDSRRVDTDASLTGGGPLSSNLTLGVNYYASLPQALGSASAGVSTAAARGDHVHPAVDLSDATQTQGALPLGRGGTGDALSPVAGAVVYSTGTKFALADPGLPGQVLTSAGTGEPYWATVSGTGTVTSVAASGGTTGMTFSGSPITAAGTLTLGGTLNVSSGGTGATTASTARTNLGAAASGANSDITSLSGITGAIGTPTYIQFDTAATVTRATGRLWWDNADGNQTLSLGMAGSNATLQIGEEMYFRVKASSAITEGQVVMFTGTVGASGALTGAPATGLTKSTASYIMGVATEDIALNGWGYVTQFGLVRGINTTGGAEAWVDGQILYYDPTVPGGLTKNQPTAPAAKVEVAAVIYAASNGSLFVRPSARFELTQLNDVESSGATNLDLLQYNGTGGYWQHRSPSTISVGSATTATNLAGGAANRIAYQTGAGATGFITAPTVANTYLEWSGSTFQWSSNPLGTVTSVDASGGTTGLTFSGGPITTSGTLTLGGTLGVANGGTGATTLTGLVKGNGTSALTAAASADVISTLGYTPANKAGEAFTGNISTTGTLAVTGATTLTGSLTANNTNCFIGPASGTADLNLYLRSTNVYNFLYFQNAGTTFGSLIGQSTVGMYYNFGQHIFRNGAGSSEYARIDASGNFGIGTSSPSGTLNIVDQNNTIFYLDEYSNADGAIIRARRYRGTIASPSAVQTGDALTALRGFGYTSAGSMGSLSASIDFYAAENFTSTAQGAFISFRTNPAGSAGAAAERMRIDSAGNVGIGTSSPGAKLDVNGIALASTDASTGNSPLVAANISTANNTTKYTSLLFQGRDTVNTGKNVGLVLCGPSDQNWVTSYLAFQTRNADALVERMRITTDGNVGIGTSSPGSKLHVNGSGFFSGSNSITGTGVNIEYIGGGAINCKNFTSGTWDILDYGASTHSFYINGSGPAMRIDSSSKVGIGTSSPSAKLHISGSSVGNSNIRLTNTLAPRSWEFNPYTTGDSDSKFAIRDVTAAADRIAIDSSGNVGIGTSSPGQKLEVIGSARASNLLLNADSATIGYADNSSSFILYNATGAGGITNTIRMVTNGAERARIDASGNFGIGTGSPTFRLTAANSSTDGGWLYSTGAVSVLGLGGFSSATDGAFSLRYDRASGGITFNGGLRDTPTERMRIDGSGNVGIGTSSPSSYGKLTVNGNIVLGAPTARNAAATNSIGTWTTGDPVDDSRASIGFTTVAGASSSSSYITFSTNNYGVSGGERMRLDASGNLGIGTSSPNNKLDVNGSVNIGAALLTGTGVSTGDCQIELGGNRTGNGNAYIDWHATAGTDLESRIIRYGGTNGGMDIINFGTGGMVISQEGAAPLVFKTTATERMRIDSSGNVGIGQSNPTTKLWVGSSGTGSGTATPDAISLGNTFANTAGDPAKTKLRLFQDSTPVYYGFGVSANLMETHVPSGSAMAWYVGGTERARINSSGEVLVNTTTTFGKLSVYGTTGFNADANAAISGSGSFKFRGTAAGTTITTYDYLNYTAVQFIRDNGNPTNTVGSITCTDTATTYNTSSDRRLKKDIAPAGDAGATIDAIEIVSHGWKASEGTVPFGVIAQDLHAVAPQAVHAGDAGEEVSDVWGVDYSKLVPMLIKEVQSLRARVAQLEGK